MSDGQKKYIYFGTEGVCRSHLHCILGTQDSVICLQQVTMQPALKTKLNRVAMILQQNTVALVVFAAVAHTLFIQISPWNGRLSSDGSQQSDSPLQCSVTESESARCAASIVPSNTITVVDISVHPTKSELSCSVSLRYSSRMVLCHDCNTKKNVCVGQFQLLCRLQYALSPCLDA